MYRFYLMTFLITVISCNSNSRNTIENNADSSLILLDNLTESNTFSLLIVENPDTTFGYIVFKDSVPYIIQKNIPGKSGNNGFSDSASAYKVADYVIHKLKHNIIPPTISKQELDSLLNFKLNHE